MQARPNAQHPSLVYPQVQQPDAANLSSEDAACFQLQKSSIAHDLAINALVRAHQRHTRRLQRLASSLPNRTPTAVCCPDNQFNLPLAASVDALQQQAYAEPRLDR